MTRIALIIAFFGGGVASLFSLFASNDYFALIPFPELAIYLPALILGLPAMFTLRCFPTSIIVLACSALPFASLFHVAANDFERGLFICATIATTIPVACLIIKSGELRLCASAFVLGSLVNLGYIVAISGTGGFGRLGAAETVEHGAVSNANGFGGQMAVAAILAVTILLRDGKKTRDRSSSPSLSLLAVSTVGLLYLAVLLSGSRGAIISLSCASLVILFGGKMTIHRLMAMLMAVLLGGAAIVAEAGFLSTAFARFGDNSTLMTMGDRLPIWEAALEAFGDHRWTGVGTGGVEQTLAQYMIDLQGAHFDEFGISRKSSHNAYIEWILSMGLPGAFLGIFALVKAAKAAIRLDRMESVSLRRALLLYCFVFGITIVLFRELYWVPAGSLLFAVLSMNMPKAHATQSPNMECRSVNNHSRASDRFTKRVVAPNSRLAELTPVNAERTG